MDKPEFLFHGSQYLYSILKPQKANGSCEEESLNGIYASHSFDLIIPFALPIRWYPDEPSGKRSFSCSDGITKIEYGSLNPNGIGYVYKVDSSCFTQIDDWQWISTADVIPLEVKFIRVRDYWDKIKFSEQAKKINDMLY